LSDEVDLNERIQIACLPSPTQVEYKNGTQVWIMGWGKEENSSKAFAISLLRNVRLTLIDNHHCRGLYNVKHNWTKQICAGDLNGLKNACQGICSQVDLRQRSKKQILLNLSKISSKLQV
jgi:hypothetical protein